MKKIPLIVTIILAFVGITYSLSINMSKGIIGVNQFKSGSQSTKQEQNQVEIILGARPESPEALGNLKSNLPYSTTSFSISWNDTSNQADIRLFKPYDESTQLLLFWLGEIGSSSLPSDTLKIIKE